MTPYDIATNKVRHYSSLGICPDEINGHDSLDPSCPACQLLVELKRAGGGEEELLDELATLTIESVELLEWFAGDTT